MLLLAATNAPAGLYTETFSSGDSVGTIPDGNPVGVTFGGSVSDVASSWTVIGLTVSLNVSGGYNGDLYGYLVAPNGTLVTLMNQPGVTVNTPFGNLGSGMNLTLADSGAAMMANSDLSSGTYSAVGSLSRFNGSAANGTWMLFFADVASGGGTSVLDSWSLNITAVPEPENMALSVFGLMLALGLGWRRLGWLRATKGE